MKVFITGIAGFLGSHLADAWLARGAEVVGCDNLVGGDAGNVPSSAVMYRADCRDNHAMQGLIKGCDLVYHTACLAHEGLSVFSPHLICDNVLGASASVFSAAINARVKRIVYLSSMSRYGVGDPPFLETYEPRPVDPYGIAKVAAEETLRTLCEAHGVEYAIAVPHNIVGPRQRYTDPYRNVVSIMINRMLQGKPPIIYGDGSQVRCFSPVSDIIPCLVAMGELEAAKGEIINLGPDSGEISISALAKIIAGEVVFTESPIYIDPRPCEVHHATCDASKSRALLGYAQRETLRGALRSMIEDIRRKGSKPFQYNLNIEIVNEFLPKSWSERLL